jgi:hypothetical protein
MYLGWGVRQYVRDMNMGNSCTLIHANWHFEALNEHVSTLGMLHETTTAL